MLWGNDCGTVLIFKGLQPRFVLAGSSGWAGTSLVFSRSRCSVPRRVVRFAQTASSSAKSSVSAYEEEQPNASARWPGAGQGIFGAHSLVQRRTLLQHRQARHPWTTSLREKNRRNEALSTCAMVVVVGVIGDQLCDPETIELCCDTSTVQALHEIVLRTCRERALATGQDVSHLGVRLFSDGGATALECGNATLSSVRVVPSSAVLAAISFDAEVAPTLHQCEPSFGPVGGGNKVFIHGQGFTLGQGFGGGHLRVAFGSNRQVSATRVSDSVLECVAPPHPAGPVTVQLLCGSELEQGAAYQYLEPELMYDAIFASTNSHCPTLHVLRGRTEEDEGQEPADETPRWGL